MTPPIVAFTLVQVKPGYEHQVATELEKVPEIEEVYLVYGEWDLIVKIKAKTIKELKEIVIKKIRALPAVETTSTLVVTD